MKITKTFTGVFLLTFLIGIISFYLLILKTEKNVEQVEITQVVPSDFPVPKVETKIEPEILEENNDWETEEESKFKTKLLETGEGFRGDQIDAKSGEIWLGLFKEQESYSLRSTEIKIRRVYDEIVDEDETKKTGKSVGVEGKLKPIFLLKNANKLREAKITTLFQGLTMDEISEAEESELVSNEILTTLVKDFVQKYKIGGKEYELKVIKAKNKNNEKIFALILESEGIRQVLHTSAESNLGTLYWVGDLDRDSQPDFYFSLYIQENTEYKNLFLSSEAERGKLVKKVAVFSTSGC